MGTANTDRCCVCGNRSAYCVCNFVMLDAQLPTRCVVCGNMWTYCVCNDTQPPTYDDCRRFARSEIMRLFGFVEVTMLAREDDDAASPLGYWDAIIDPLTNERVDLISRTLPGEQELRGIEVVLDGPCSACDTFDCTCFDDDDD